MDNISHIDAYFKLIQEDLAHALPEGFRIVDIDLLTDLDLLNFYKDTTSSFTRFFQVIESDDRITLINEQFIVWIVPEKSKDYNATYILIALNKGSGPKLELGFLVEGVYNTSKLVLRLLEKYLFEIQDIEDTISRLNTNP